MRYLVAPVVALVCAIATIVPAAAAPSSHDTSATLTCERGAGATAWVYLYTEDSGTLVNVYKLTCGTDSPTGERSMRVRSSNYADVGWIDYSLTVAGQPAEYCFWEGPPPHREICEGAAAGPGATLTVR
ncbi:MAG: hypothetical protein ACRDHF_12890 [Tepidiformaceae bacterium]